MTATKTLKMWDRFKVLFTGTFEARELYLPRLEQLPEQENNFLKRSNTAPERKVEKGEVNIEYDPELVQSLKEEHKYLLKVFNNIILCVKAGKNGEEGAFELAGITLGEFHRFFQGHVMKENVCLWAFLKKKKFRESYQDVKALHKSVLTIQSQVNRFCEKYKGDVDKNNADKFLEGFAGQEGKSKSAQVSQKNSLGGILTARIETEEANPYQLYDTLGKIN